MSDYLEALDILSDYGPKLFKDSFPKYMVEISQILVKSDGISVSDAYILRQIVLNFSYELPGKIVSRLECLAAFNSAIVSALVNTINEDNRL